MVLCIQVFIARFIDVSLGTVRTYLTVKGKRKLATIVAFIEVLIWFYVVRSALLFDGNGVWLLPFAYAGGYAAGTSFGIVLIDKVFNEFIRVQIITKQKNDPLVEVLLKEGYAMTIMDLRNTRDGIEKEMLVLEIKKKSLSHLQEIVKATGENYFLTVNETKYIQNGIIK